MKLPVILAAMALSTASLLAQNLTIMNTNDTLTRRQLALAECACLEAQDDIERLDVAIWQALEVGVTVNELKEAFSQLYAYTGFPRSLNALSRLQTVMAPRERQGKTDDEGKVWTRPSVWDDAKAAYEYGKMVQQQLTGGPYHNDFSPQNEHYLKSHLFGDIFAGDQLTAADRELVTVAALTGMEGVEAQLAAHKRGAVNMGNTPEQVEVLCRHLSRKGLSWADCAAEATAGDWAKGSPNTAYAQYFTGQSHLAPIRPRNLPDGTISLQGYSNVTFEPGCRNNWHIHHGARQILICVSGRGWYQEWGKPAIQLTPGTIIEIPEEVKHWHGAAYDSWFQHLATHVDISDKTSNEWLEPVDDETYNNLRNTND